MAHVVISHSGADRAYVQGLAAHLETSGIDVWYDAEIGAGQRWTTVIERKIDACDAMVVVMTPAARDSTMVASQIDLAQSRGKPFLPVLLDGEPFLGLRHLPYTDVRGGVLPGPEFLARLGAVAPSEGAQPAQPPPPVPWPPPMPAAPPMLAPPVFAPPVFAPPAHAGPGRQFVAREPTQALTLRGHTDAVAAVAFNPTIGMLATASWDQTVRVWDISGTHRHTLAGHSDWVNAVAFSPDGRFLATVSNDETIRLWDAATATYWRTLTTQTGGVRAVAFAPYLPMLATAGWGGAIHIWDLYTGNHLRSLTGHTEAVSSLAFSVSGVLASGSDDATVRLWDNAAVYRSSLVGHDAEVTAVAFSPDGRYLATASADHSARILDSATGFELTTLAGHTGPVGSVAFSTGTVATGSADHTARIWDTASGAHLATLTGHSDAVNAVTYSPDGTHLATASDDETAILWRVGEWR